MEAGRRRAASLQLGWGGDCRSVQVGFHPFIRLQASAHGECDADLTEVVIVLNSDEAVKAFSRGGNVTVGGKPISLNGGLELSRR